MRKRAAKRLGTPSVPDKEIAEEFLRTACQRKASLRKDFSRFLSKALAKPVSLAG
jgi:benzoyl-CoA reductase/2-hydroxyglutaryl-CoA dehydratase subunit BcrC/BadD/HgdB